MYICIVGDRSGQTPERGQGSHGDEFGQQFAQQQFRGDKMTNDTEKMPMDSSNCGGCSDKVFKNIYFCVLFLAIQQKRYSTTKYDFIVLLFYYIKPSNK